MNERQRSQLSDYAAEAAGIEDGWDARRWAGRVSAFLQEAIGPDEADRFLHLNLGDDFDVLALRRGHIEGLITKGESELAPEESGNSSRAGAEPEPIASDTREIFVVHGHDGESKESVARFLEKLGLSPVILHEQPNQGRTLEAVINFIPLFAFV
jgi:hypothetical protein